MKLMKLWIKISYQTSKPTIFEPFNQLSSSISSIYLFSLKKQKKSEKIHAKNT